MWIKRGESLYFDCGFSDLEHEIPFKRDAICRLFSVSKVFTTIAIHKAIELGLLAKRNLLSDFLPAFKNPKVLMEDGSLKEVACPTIQDLLNMCTGFGYGEGKNGKAFEEVEKSNYRVSTFEFASLIAQNPLLYVPRTKRSYSLAADLLGEVIEKASHLRFSEFLDKYIFIPANTKDMGFSLNDKQRKRLVPCYVKENGHWQKMRRVGLGIDIQGRETLFESGGAGLFGTIDDVASFGTALLEGKILRKETLESLYKEEKDDLCFPSDWMAPEGMVYKNLLKICREAKEPSDIQGDFGWNGWLGCHIALNARIGRVYVFFTQVADYGEGKENSEFRNILYKNS